jgi:hemerythrin-like domain-containing protein
VEPGLSLSSLEAMAAEHEHIGTMRGVLDAIATRFEAGRSVPQRLLDDLLEFFKEFVEAYHDIKEETALFPLLAQHGYNREASAVNALLVQHEIARAYVRELRAAADRVQAGDPQAGGDFAVTARAYVELLREHVRIEDTFVFPLAARLLSAADGHRLRARCEDLDRAHAAVRGRFERIVTDCVRVVADWGKGETV